MKKNNQTMRKHTTLKTLCVGLFAGMGMLAAGNTANAQCGFASGLGCENTNYENFGLNSNNDAASIEYDNYVSTFHATLVRSFDGNFLIWGEQTANNGSNNNLSPTTINASNYSGLTGIPIKATMGSNRENSVQTFLLTSDNKLWVWGNQGTVVATSRTSGATKQVLNAGTNGLPNGVSATDVKMLTATYENLTILTCGGDVWMLSQTDAMRGQGTANSSSRSSGTWYKVKTGNSTYLTDIIAVRVAPKAAFALDKNGEIWTWGSRTYNGSTSYASESYAKKMTKPAGAPSSASIKMIGITGTTSYSGNGNHNASTYYVLYNNGSLYSLGDGHNGLLGDFGTSNSNSWKTPMYPAATAAQRQPMTDIKWISASDHDGGYAFINVLNNAGGIYNWGQESAGHLNRGTQNSTTSSSTVHPGVPSSLAGKYVLAVNSGGHTTMVSVKCEENFGYTGHRVRGSMGDGSNLDGAQNSFTFNTAYVQPCGVTTVPVINIVGQEIVNVSGKYCKGQTLILEGIPSGGTFTLTSGSSAATLNGNRLTLNGTGVAKVKYEVDGNFNDCNPVPYAERTFEIVDNCNLLSISGNVWIDDDWDAMYDNDEHGTSGKAGSFNGFWANLINAAGVVVASVPVQNDGTYEIMVNNAATYSVILTTQQIGVGTPSQYSIINAGKTTIPSMTGWVYSGKNFGNTTSNACVTKSPSVCTEPWRITNIVVSSTTAPVKNINFGIIGTYNVQGKVFHDPNGLVQSTPAVDGSNINATGGAYVSQNNSPLYVSLLDDNGVVVHYVPVQNDGTYSILVPVSEDAVLQVTSVEPTIGAINEAPELPDGWAFVGETFGDNNDLGTGVNDGTGSGANAPSTRYDGKIHVTFDNPLQPADKVDFGLDQRPTPAPKYYEVDNKDYSKTGPSGYPTVTGYRSIPASSIALVETTDLSNGSLSGSDPEDCATGACNGNPGSTNITTSFAIDTIKANTKLYYDFGGTIEVKELHDGDIIPDFDIAKLVIYGQEGSGTTGNEIGFTYHMIDAAGIMSKNPAPYEISNPFPLPIKLLSFDVHKEGSVAYLEWATATESNNQGFEIERSNDGRNWSNIGYVESKAENGNSSFKLSYDFVDAKPLVGKNFYRFKQLDYDGQYAYSQVRMVQFSKTATLDIFPNPAENTISVTGLNGNEIIRVVDNFGRVLSEQKANNTTQNISVSDLATGVYQLVVIDAEGRSQSIKLMKK